MSSMQLKKDNISKRIFIQSSGSIMSHGWELGVLVVKSLKFLNLVMWHIKLKWLMSGTGYKYNIFEIRQDPTKDL